MLNFEEKMNILNSILSGKELSYADSFNTDIIIGADNSKYNFLEK